MRLIVKLWRSDGVSTVELVGPLMVEDDMEELREKLALLFNENRFVILLYLGNCYGLSFAGLAAIRKICDEATRRGGTCLLYGACLSVTAVLDNDPAIMVFADEQEARKMLEEKGVSA